MRAASNPVLLCAALAAALSADCSRSAVQQTTARSAVIQLSSKLAAEQTLAFSIDNAPTTLDPLLTSEGQTQHILDDLFEGLVAVGIDGRPVPGVASDWNTSGDGKTWTFHLRANARWSNGAPVTAENFVYAWRREVDPKTGAPFAQFLAVLVNAREITAGRLPAAALGVESPDPRTLIVHLSSPVPYLLDLLDQQYFYPAYEPAIARWGDQWVLPEHMVCNGAFRLQEEVSNSRITLAKNSSYWDARRVQLEHVTYLVVTDSNIQSLRFQSGDVQFTYNFPSSQYRWLKEHFGDQAVTAPYLGTMLIEFNMQAPPFRNNPALRRALSMAIDRTVLTRYLKQGLNQAAFDLVPPLDGYAQPVPPWATLSDSQRYQEARRLYAEAGYSTGHPLRLELSIPNQGPDDRHAYEAIVDMWNRHLGAQVSLDVRELKVLIQEEQLHKLTLYQLAWIGDYPDALTFLDLFRTGSDDNFEQYSSSHFDELMSTAEHAVDPEARYRLLANAEDVLNEDSAMIPLFYYGSRHLIAPYVKGWRSNLSDRHPSRFMYLLEHAAN
jgi:oligopeptide transport system substrate-binding protein